MLNRIRPGLVQHILSKLCASPSVHLSRAKPTSLKNISVQLPYSNFVLVSKYHFWTTLWGRGWRLPVIDGTYYHIKHMVTLYRRVITPDVLISARASKCARGGTVPWGQTASDRSVICNMWIVIQDSWQEQCHVWVTAHFLDALSMVINCRENIRNVC